jgi:ubiquinone/menaquinone biosynthesis C-methylase UbiE
VSATASVALSPRAYAAWRSTTQTERLELRTILDLMGELAGARLLDVGCGDGPLALAAAARGAEVVGVDADPAMLGAARIRARSDGVCATEKLPFADGAFDAVAAITVLCFISDAAGAIREIARVLKPGGRLVIGELGRVNAWAAIRRVRGCFSSALWRAARFRSAAELCALAEHAGLTVVSVRGAIFYPPAGICARLMASLDPWLGRLTILGAAFITLSAKAPGDAGRS